MSSIRQVWLKPSRKAQWKGEEDKADRGRGGKTTSGNGQAWSSASPRGLWRTGKNGKKWLQIICSAPMTLVVKGLMMMMMMTMMTPSLAAKRSVITIMYYKTKFGGKRTGSSKDTVGIVIFWSKLSALALTLTLLDLQNSKSIFLQNTLTHDDASQ